MFCISLICGLVGLTVITVNARSEEECFQLGEASLYTGTKSTTVSGLECQRWDKQTPHEHDNVKGNFPERSLCRAKNYCRDPGNEGFPWCYTMDPETRWESCGIPWCNEPARNNNTHDCYVLTEEDLNGEKSKTEVCESSPYRESVCENGNVQEGCETCEHCCQTKGCFHYLLSFKGTWHRTESGRECQRWDEQTPHDHNNNKDYKFTGDGSVYAAHNYCRDPDFSGFLWCYSMDPNVRWERCGIPKC